MLNNTNHQEHVMELTVHSSGAQEWFCLTCERRFLVSWTPTYKRIIIEAGDETVPHVGGTGGLSIMEPEIVDGEEPVLPDHLLDALDQILKDS